MASLPFADQGGDAGRISDGSAVIGSWLDSRHRFAEPFGPEPEPGTSILSSLTARHHLGGNKLGAAPIAWIVSLRKEVSHLTCYL